MASGKLERWLTVSAMLVWKEKRPPAASNPPISGVYPGAMYGVTRQLSPSRRAKPGSSAPATLGTARQLQIASPCTASDRPLLKHRMYFS
jgi:hypothetical protein